MKTSKKVLAGTLSLSMLLGMTAVPAMAEEGKELEGKLVYWSMWNDTEPQGMVWQQIIDGFMEEHPGVEIEVQWCGRDNKKVLKPAMEGNETIDVFEYPFEIDLNDYLLDMTPYLDKAFDSLDGKTLNEVLLPSMIQTPKTMTGLDIQPAVGYKPWMSLFMYNKAIFEEAGVEAEPTTWEELDAACAKIKEAGYVPITFDDAYAAWLPGMYLAREKGQEWVQELVNDTTGEMWKDEAVMNMAKAYEDFAAKGYFDANVSGNKYPQGQQDIGSGKVAMYYNLTGLTTEVSSVTGPDFVWGGFSFPDVVEGESKAGKEDPTGCTMLAVNKNTENADLAMEFVAYALNPENDMKMVSEAGTTPATAGAEWPKSLESMKGVFESNETHLNSGADITSNPDIAPTITENFVKLAAGEITAEDFVNTLSEAAAK